MFVFRRGRALKLRIAPKSSPIIYLPCHYCSGPRCALANHAPTFEIMTRDSISVGGAGAGVSIGME